MWCNKTRSWAQSTAENWPLKIKARPRAQHKSKALKNSLKARKRRPKIGSKISHVARAILPPASKPVHSREQIGSPLFIHKIKEKLVYPNFWRAHSWKRRRASFWLLLLEDTTSQAPTWSLSLADSVTHFPCRGEPERRNVHTRLSAQMAKVLLLVSARVNLSKSRNYSAQYLRLSWPCASFWLPWTWRRLFLHLEHPTFSILRGESTTFVFHYAQWECNFRA